MSIVWIAQSMEVHREIRRNTDDLYLFRITEPGDLDKIAERCGRITSDRVANLRRLRKENGKAVPGELLFWSVDNA